MRVMMDMVLMVIVVKCDFIVFFCFFVGFEWRNGGGLDGFVGGVCLCVDVDGCVECMFICFGGCGLGVDYVECGFVSWCVDGYVEVVCYCDVVVEVE